MADFPGLIVRMSHICICTVNVQVHVLSGKGLQSEFDGETCEPGAGGVVVGRERESVM